MYNFHCPIDEDYYKYSNIVVRNVGLIDDDYNIVEMMNSIVNILLNDDDAYE